MPAAGLTCHLRLLADCLLRDESVFSGDGRRRRRGAGLDADMARIEGLALGHHRPQDASSSVGQRHGGLLPTHALPECGSPLRDRIAAFVGRHHG